MGGFQEEEIGYGGVGDGYGDFGGGLKEKMVNLEKWEEGEGDGGYGGGVGGVGFGGDGLMVGVVEGRIRIRR